MNTVFTIEEILKIRSDDNYLKEKMNIMIENILNDEDNHKKDLIESIYMATIVLSYAIHDTETLDDETLRLTSKNIYERYMNSMKGFFDE